MNDRCGSDNERFVDLNLYVDGKKVEQLRLGKHSTFDTEIDGTPVSIEVLRLVEYEVTGQ